MKKLLLLLAAGLASASPAIAAPVYLSCDLGSVPFWFTLDEDRGTVTVKVADETRVYPAQFGPDVITWKASTSRFSTFVFTIDRTTLGASLNEEYGNSPSVGRCEITNEGRQI